MAFKYGAWLRYSFNNSGDAGKSSTVPIYLFKVDGGANRVIDTQTTNDVSLTSELEQARSYKNIILGMPPLGDGSDMKAALDLTEAAAKKLPVEIEFEIYKYANGKAVEAMSLKADQAHVKKQPQLLSNNWLKIEVSFSVANLERIMLNSGKKPKHYPF